MDRHSENNTNQFFLEVRNITKMFGQFTALSDISVGINQGEFVSVLGPSGCGKTTLLRVIAGLEEQNSGSVWIAGRDVSREPVANRKLGIVFQSYALFPNINIIGNVQYGINRRQFSKPEREQRAMEMLELVGIEEQSHKYPAQLSGGQQQRVALARRWPRVRPFYCLMSPFRHWMPAFGSTCGQKFVAYRRLWGSQRSW
jgi:iron(III) transport system ATP-binding protein